jgi:hypothetical protein
LNNRPPCIHEHWRAVQASAEFSEKELAYHLTSTVASINVWNRFGAAFRWTPPAQAAVGAAASQG